MSSIEIGAPRPVGPVQVKTATNAKAAPAAAATVAVEPQTPSVVDAGPAANVQRSSALDAGSAAPVDVERVKDIRQAIEKGNYPLVPARIADAMIAAGMLLRTAS
ncbi:MAG: flagellar biosynthesis anti-sigma factor FlgM [Novosphingobium sp. 32-60-15]|jgi:negative regulator of flagellin synthesis FlgM|uniref:flagellar biosynthesis anti-sigma factor FlgM n=1 Tax=unclassified Novosphingobium TaxID=2644732 RepID=UPI000BCCA741|nr:MULTISPECIES: flagellar biosynthesis anti-sigma factor FlgM [unclassified Novosphingobium]OYX61527.1 MAG: flagellar biosynthesis anti-sigma factor FlgM [Novosphingobium sp. 32-60-15]